MNHFVTYRVRVPAKVPVKQFWQIPFYEVATRSMIATDQKKSVLSSTQDLQKNAYGSVDLYFGPELPDGVGYRRAMVGGKTRKDETS